MALTRHRISILFAVIVATTGLAACSSGSSDTPVKGSPSSAALDSATCTPESGALRIYLNPYGKTLAEKFTKDTGIKTEIADVGGGEILSRIAAEANNPQWDVVILDGHGSLQGLDDSGQLLTGRSPANLANLNAAGQALAPKNHSWVPFSEHAAAVIAYNTNKISPADAPKTWSDLTNPKYAPIGIADPAVAAPAYPIVSWSFQSMGTDAAKKYFDTLFNNGVKTYPKNGPVADALSSGEVKVAMLQEQNVYGLMESGEPVKFVWPDEGAPGVVRAVAISAQTPRPCDALKLEQWMLDPANVAYLMKNGGDDGIITPYVSNVDTSSLPKERPVDGKLNITNAEFAAKNEASIKDWFANKRAG